MLKEEDLCFDWEKFKRAFFNQYGDQFSGSLFMQLKILIDEFIENFDMVASQIFRMSNEQYLGLFIGGPMEEIRMELQVLEPTTRYKVISMVRNV